jgi:hypothetical protein
MLTFSFSMQAANYFQDDATRLKLNVVLVERLCPSARACSDAGNVSPPESKNIAELATVRFPHPLWKIIVRHLVHAM